MAANIKPEVLKPFIPFDELADGHLSDLIEKSTLLNVGEGKMIFKRDDEDTFGYWLLAGSVDLLDEKFNVRSIKAGAEGSQFPLDNNSPHKVTAVSTVDSRIFRVEKSYLDLVLSWDQAGDYTVSEIDDVMDAEVYWMSAMLSSPLFEFVPPGNIQQLFTKFEEVTYAAGDTVIKQGEPGDYFYVITVGKASVQRTSGDKTTTLAELSAGAFFGEDALISDVPRNATITMLTAGKLMRLSEPDFESLLQKPLMEIVTLEEAQEMMAAGDPKTYILDVRSPKELESGKIEGSVNVPLLLLRKNLDRLKKDAIYIARCDGGKRYEMAAFQLNQSGYTAYVMKKAPD